LDKNLISGIINRMIIKDSIWKVSLAIFIAIAIYFVFVLELGINNSETSPTPTATPIADKSVNFNHVGNFHMSDPKLKPNEFYLIYETPGSPAMSVRLYFDTKTMCQDPISIESCPRPVFPDGARITVQGTQIKNYVIVKKIIID